MKQQIVLAVFFIAFTASASFGQWNMNGTDTTYTNNNVGIKTNNPVAALDVNGAIHSSGSTVLYNGTPTGDAFLMGWTNDFLNVSGRDYLLFKKIDVNDPTPDGGIAFLNKGSDGVEKVSLLINGVGNIGIGATSPDVKLHVNGDARVGGFLRVGGNTDGNAWKMGVTGNIITRNGTVVLGAVATDKIGIGTTSPDVKLHVNGDARVGGFLRVGGNTDGSIWKMGVTGNIITRNGNVVLGAVATDKIGIGTTSPDVKLHVNGDARVGGFLRVGGNTDGNAWKMGISGNIITRQGKVVLGAETNDMIGVGTTDPTAKLHVLGHATFELPGTIRDLKINSNSTLIDPFFHPSEAYYGYIGASNYPFKGVFADAIYRNFEYTLSDSRMKKNVSTIQNAADLINSLRGVRYDLITDKLPGISEEAATRIKGNNQLGFIAQEIKEVLPELVITEEESGLNMVSYEGVIPVLVEAFQEHHSLLEEKDELISALEDKVATLEDRLEKIEQMLGEQVKEENSKATLDMRKKSMGDVQVFPNPTNGLLTVKFQPIQFNQRAMVVILDVNGRKIASQSVENGASQVEFNLSNEPAGTYFFQMLVDGIAAASGNVLLVK